ncbi:MAG TPA: PqqD family protein [Candidatus Mediterraneibacter excrementigallinarum]|nr:PqqD family protein [Candidatus Mediterraneibacter excrementigallinarum]
MKTNSEYMLREIAGESVLIPTGSASQKLNGMIRLTDTAAFIWKQVDTAADLREITERVREEFDVDNETARRDVRGFLYELYIRGMVLDVPELEQKGTGEQEQK